MSAYVGRSPIKTVERPIAVMVTRNVYFRPMMSPRAPKMTAPNGRTRKPAAYAAKPESCTAVGFVPGKKSGERNGVSVA